MSFEDFAAKMKAKSQQGKDQPEEKPFDFGESYRIRGKMIGVLLRDARLSAARTVEDCARLLHVTPDQIERWEYGTETPSLPQLEMLAYYLDVPVSHFWGLETLKVSRAGGEKIQPEYIGLRNRMVGALLRQAREEMGLSIEDIGKACGLPAQKVSQYELGELAPPMHELSSMASAVNKNISYFLESNGQIGELLAMREAWKHFSELPEDIREFAANPVNVGFIHIAVMFSQMPADRLREVAATLADITM